MRVRDKQKQREYDQKRYQQKKEEINKKSAAWKSDNKNRVTVTQLAYQRDNREKVYEINSRWRKKNKVSIAEWGRQYRAKNKEKIKRYMQRWRIENRARKNELGRQSQQRIKDKVFHMLGDVCCRCGFTDVRALQVDHINQAVEKRGEPKRAGKSLYAAIARGEKPITEFQLLCANCNWIKRYENNEHNHHKGNK